MLWDYLPDCPVTSDERRLDAQLAEIVKPRQTPVFDYAKVSWYLRRDEGFGKQYSIVESAQAIARKSRSSQRYVNPKIRVSTKQGHDVLRILWLALSQRDTLYVPTMLMNFQKVPRTALRHPVRLVPARARFEQLERH